MKRAERERTRPYRWEAFSHWLNVLFLAAGGAAAMYHPILWLALVPLEAGALWVLPDLPPFRARVDRKHTEREIARERSYYLEYLFGIRPAEKTLAQRVWGLFVERDDETDETLSITHAGSKEHSRYRELQEIVVKLRELDKVRGIGLAEHDFLRFEQVINGYLRLLLAYRSLGRALGAVDTRALEKEQEEIEAQLVTSPSELRSVLLERRQMCDAQLQRLPKLTAVRELFGARIDAIVLQFGNLYGQVVSDPGTNVNTLLDEMVERHEILADPLGELEADQMVRQTLAQVNQGTEGSRASRAAARAQLTEKR